MGVSIARGRKEGSIAKPVNFIHPTTTLSKNLGVSEGWTIIRILESI